MDLGPADRDRAQEFLGTCDLFAASVGGPGKLDAACHSAGIALDLAATIDSPRVAGHVREFHGHLAPYAREMPVIAFEQRMREVLS